MGEVVTPSSILPSNRWTELKRGGENLPGTSLSRGKRRGEKVTKKFLHHEVIQKEDKKERGGTFLLSST